MRGIDFIIVSIVIGIGGYIVYKKDKKKHCDMSCEFCPYRGEKMRKF